MNRYAVGVIREQLTLLPMCFDDMISEDNVVRAIDAIVDSMDILSLGFTHSKTATIGRKPYSPVDMFKLYTYSYFNGIRSSRKMENECYRNIEVMWLINELKPDFKTIADFRKDNIKQIKLAFRKFSMICDELGLIGKEIVAVDGSKFRANNGRKAYHTEKRLKKPSNITPKPSISIWHCLTNVILTKATRKLQRLIKLKLKQKSKVSKIDY